MTTENIESVYVKDSYSSFAKGFNDTRILKWSSSYTFINSLPSGASMFDAGCGNGRNMEIRSDLICTGCDQCDELLDICRSKNLNVFNADIRNIPLEDNSVDYTICIAVIGHIFNESDRILAIKELLRITRNEVFIQCWDIDAISHSKNKDKFICINDHDYFVTWGDQKIKRYYHLFSLDEFTSLLQKCNCNIITCYVDKNGVIAKIKK